MALRGHAVDVAQQVEAVAQREVPPQLGALAEHHADATGELGALAARFESVDADVARRGHEDAREHLDGGRLPGTVRADVAHHGPALDLQIDAADGHAPPRDGAAPDRPCACTTNGLGEPCDVDDRIRGHDQLPVLRWWRTARRQTAPATSDRGERRRAGWPRPTSAGQRRAARPTEHPRGREVGDEGERHEEGEEPPQPGRRARRSGSCVARPPP